VTRHHLRSLRLGLLIALGLSVAAIASAQHGPSEVPGDLLVSDWKLGPFYVKPTFEVRDFGYDSNVFFEVEGESDMTATLAPGVRLALPFSDHLLTVDQEFAYQYFREFSEQSGWNSETAVGLELAFPAFTLDLSETFRYTKTLFSVERFTRPRRRENILEAELRSARDAGLYLEGTFFFDLLRIDEEEEVGGESLADRLDQDILRAGLGLFLEFADGARLAATGKLGDYDFKRGEPGRDGKEYLLLPGLRFDEGRALYGDLLIGYRELEIGGFQHPQFKGLAADVDLTLEFGGASELTFVAVRGTTRSDFSSILYSNVTRFGGALTVPMGDTFRLSLRPTWAELEYPIDRDEELGAEFTGRHEILSFELRGSILVGDDMSLDLGVVYRDVQGDDIGYDQFALTTGFGYGT